MSLQKCPKCKKKIPWGTVYEAINRKEKHVKCPFCNKKEKFKKEKKSFIKALIQKFLWLSVPLLMIILVAMQKLSFIIAIDIVIIFHFISMYFIIKYSKYKKH